MLTSLDAFMHGRVGDLFLAFRAQSILASITKLVMGLSDFARISALFASTLDATKPLYQQMSKWHQLFHQLRGSLVSPTPGTPHPAVDHSVEHQWLNAQLRAYEATSISSRDQAAAQQILLKAYEKPEDLLAAIRVYSEGSSLTGPCFQSRAIPPAPANGHAHGALSGAGSGGGGGAAVVSKGSGSTGSGGGGGASGGANKHSKQSKAPAAPLPAPPSHPAPQKQRGASASAGSGTPAASPPVSKKNPVERYLALVDMFVAQVPALNTPEYVELVDFGGRTVPRWLCALNASGQHSPVFAVKEVYSKLTQPQRSLVQRMRGSSGIPTSNDHIQGLSQARPVTIKRTFAAQPQAPQYSPPPQQYSPPPQRFGMHPYGAHLPQEPQQQGFAPSHHWTPGFPTPQHGYPQKPQSMQQQASVFFEQHGFLPHEMSPQQPLHLQQPTMHASQQLPTAPAVHPGGHFGVPPPGFAQSFAAQPFRPQQQQLHNRPQQSQPPFITSGPAPGELPNVLHGPWQYGAETSGPPTGF